MNTRGMTLVELLAVIVILGVLALILTPMVSNITGAAAKAAFKESVNNILESSKNYVGSYTLKYHSDTLNYPITFACDGESCSNENKEALEFSGSVPISGKVILEKGTSYASFVTNGVYCAVGYMGKLEIASNCEALDHTAPIINESMLINVTVSSTTNSIAVGFPEDLMYDEETGISRYEVSLYLNNKLVAKEEGTEVIFKGLTSDTLYKVEIAGINKNNLSTKIERSVRTGSITNPVIVSVTNPIEAVSGYVQEDK